MKKSILFSGRQGTGKTTKIKTLLSCLNQSRVTEMTFKKFQLSMKSELASQFDFIAIDEVVNAEEIEYLSMAAVSHGFFFIVGTQKTVKELEDIDLSMFHSVELAKLNNQHVVKSLTKRKQLLEMAERYVSGNKDKSAFDVGVDAYIEGYTKLLGIEYDDLPE